VIRQAAGLVMANYEGTTMGWKLGVAEVLQNKSVRTEKGTYSGGLVALSLPEQKQETLAHVPR